VIDRLDTLPTWLLSRAHQRAHDLLQAAFADAGVRGYHYRLLAALEQYGATSQASLGRLTGIDPKDVVLALNELVERSLARRDPDPHDGRRNLVAITRKGRSELQRLDGVVATVQAELLAPLTARERDQLVTLLAKLGAGDGGTVG
jgi:DNA-binding MarR family transcriptional regulator